MPKRKWIYIYFESIEADNTHNEAVDEIIKKDTGEEQIEATRDWRPIGANLTEKAVEELRQLNGVIVRIWAGASPEWGEKEEGEKEEGNKKDDT